MMTEQKRQQEFNTPVELTFNKWGKEITLTRDNMGFCDITQLRRCSPKNKCLNSFKKSQVYVIKQLEKEIETYPIKTKGWTTRVHEKTLERVLRWYGLDELKVIDGFVHPQFRTIKQYMCGGVPVLVHVESKYVNGTVFCALFEKQMYRWMDLKGTKDLLIQHKRRLGFDSGDIWIPVDMLPVLATWCNCDVHDLSDMINKLSINRNLPYNKIAFEQSELGNVSVGYVYCMSHVLFDQVYKVGKTSRDPKKRALELSRTGHYINFKVEFAKLVDSYHDVEKALHHTLDEFRINKNREFFKIPLCDIKKEFDLVTGDWYDV